jgi:signal transduction histidine kinase
VPGWKRVQGGDERPISTGSAIVVFALSGFLTLALVGAGVILLTRRSATDQAIRNATTIAEVVGRGLIEPALEDGLLEGDPEARTRLDGIVRGRIIGETIVRLKLWSPAGRVVYSDEPQLIGQQFDLGPELAEALSNNTAQAEVSDLGGPENESERPFGSLLEVYFPVHAPGGTPLLFEAYQPYDSVLGSGDEIWRRFLPTFIAGLVVLELVQLPLAWSLARRLNRRQAERELLLRRAIDASERERRVIAGELHDSAVQDLVGQSYALEATADRLGPNAAPEVVQPIRDAAARTRHTVQGLRSLLVDLYPPNLQTEGIEAAISDLAAPLRSKGVEVTISGQPGARLSDEGERILYRAAREALRNVQLHAEAGRVDIAFGATGRTVSLAITDDGRGFEPAERDRRRTEGHLGLDLVEGLVADAGGSVSIAPVDGGGTRFYLELPAP